MNKNKFLITSLVSTFLSLALFVYLSFQHYWIKLGISSGPSICNINARFNCDVVASSQYASLLGVPIAVLGFFTYSMIFMLLLGSFIAISENHERYKRYGFYLNLFTNIVSIVMGIISSIYIGTFCLFCVASYTLSFISSFMIWKSLEEDALPNVLQDIKELFIEHKFVGIFVVGIPAISYFFHTIFLDSYGFNQMNLGIKSAIANYKAAPIQNLDYKKGLILQKSENIKMTIVEFADFRCPHCKMAYSSLHNFTESRKDVRLVFKFFPLDGTCNPALSQKGDGSSCLLAYAVSCSEKLANKGWDAHNYAFDHQDTYIKGAAFDKIVGDFSESLKINPTELKNCMDAPDTKQAVETQALEGKNIVPGTPTIFVNNKVLEGGQFLPLLEEVYKEIDLL